MGSPDLCQSPRQVQHQIFIVTFDFELKKSIRIVKLSPILSFEFGEILMHSPEVKKQNGEQPLGYFFQYVCTGTVPIAATMDTLRREIRELAIALSSSSVTRCPVPQQAGRCGNTATCCAPALPPAPAWRSEPLPSLRFTTSDLLCGSVVELLGWEGGDGKGEELHVLKKTKLSSPELLRWEFPLLEGK